MRICIIATEFKEIGPYGGFGVLSYDIATGLSRKGVDVYLVMPRKQNQPPILNISGVKVISFPWSPYVSVKNEMEYLGVFKFINADVYHSEEPTIGSALAKMAMPTKKHIVTFQDPRNLSDWREQWGSKNPISLYEKKFYNKYIRVIGKAVRNTDKQFCQAKFIIPKVMEMYKLKSKPGFLPNPVKLQDNPIIKSKTPTVCFVGRFDYIKRPELYLELASNFPNVRFNMIGANLENYNLDKSIREKIHNIENIYAPGWVTAEQRNELLSKSWILINTSTKECLPVSYLEAAAQKCAILAHVNADEFASNFGFFAKQGDLYNYIDGINYLLENNRWQYLGEKAYDYVVNVHEYEKVIQQHIEIYQNILS